MPDTSPALPGMNISIAKDHLGMSRAASEWLFDQLTGETADQVILAATGNTPMQSYEMLGRNMSEQEIDTSDLTVVQLDEYAGIERDDPRSLYGWMDRSFLQPLNIPESHVIAFDASTSQPAAMIAEYDARIRRSGGIDIAILGLGPNGHLGFNEPPSPADAPTRLVDLTPASLASNAVYFPEGTDIPRQAFTCGMSTILAANHILLLVSGPSKKDILKLALTGPVTPDVPASMLQTVASRVWLFADELAWDDLE